MSFWVLWLVNLVLGTAFGWELHRTWTIRKADRQARAFLASLPEEDAEDADELLAEVDELTTKWSRQ